ncbi:AMP-binding protein [Tepidamorphus sp. 3E244]|uniref:AMP-binding protein n=1 Tax=Tepidamorphus sp. 3E244 TaxID=3385498 RepID=UPI0038FCF1FA
MILGDPKRWDELAEAGIYGTVTLDEMLRRAARARGEDIAVSDHAGNAATWSELDRKADRLADFLLDLGLKQDDVVVVLSGANLRSIVSLMGISRAGMIAMPLSPLVGALEAGAIAESANARAIIADEQVGPCKTADTAAIAAFAAFNVRFLLGFGDMLPDGVIGLDEMLEGSIDAAGETSGALRGGRASDHVFVLTADGDDSNRFLAPRNHGQLAATAMPLALQGRISSASVLATPILPTSLNGLSLLACWLISSARLHFLAPWEPGDMVSGATEAEATHIALPGRLMATVGEIPDDVTLIRMWRDTVDSNAAGDAHALDTASLGEAGLMVWSGETQRNHIPLGGLCLDGETPPAILTPRIQGVVHKAENAVEPGSLMRGPLCVRGAGTPVMGFPKDPTGQDRFVDNGFMLTALRGELVEADGPKVRVLGSAGRTLKLGSMAFDPEAVDALYSQIEGVEDAAAIPVKHPVLGHVLTMAYTGDTTLSLKDVVAQLEASGISAHKIPASIAHVEAILRDGDGRPARDKRALAQMAG